MLFISAHPCAVRGVAFDGLNQMVMTAGADGVLKFWKFKSHMFLHEVKLPSNISCILLHRERFVVFFKMDFHSVQWTVIIVFKKTIFPNNSILKFNCLI